MPACWTREAPGGKRQTVLPDHIACTRAFGGCRPGEAGRIPDRGEPRRQHRGRRHRPRRADGPARARGEPAAVRRPGPQPQRRRAIVLPQRLPPLLRGPRHHPGLPGDRRPGGTGLRSGPCRAAAELRALRAAGSVQVGRVPRPAHRRGLRDLLGRHRGEPLRRLLPRPRQVGRAGAALPHQQHSRAALTGATA